MDGSGWLSDISIHAPRMGSDPSSFSGFEAISLFQSTLLAWGATFRSAGGSDTLEFQSTLPAWGATNSTPQVLEIFKFQSTLPAWGATFPFFLGRFRMIFQSTLPAWGATVQPKHTAMTA